MITSKTTDELLKLLSSMESRSSLHDLSDELDKPENKTSFPDYISQKMQERGISPGRLWELSLIQRNTDIRFLTEPKLPAGTKLSQYACRCRFP